MQGLPDVQVAAGVKMSALRRKSFVSSSGLAPSSSGIASGGDIWAKMKLALSSLPKYPGELEGQRPSSAEEEGASPDDERKDLRLPRRPA